MRASGWRPRIQQGRKWETVSDLLCCGGMNTISRVISPRSHLSRYSFSSFRCGARLYQPPESTSAQSTGESIACAICCAGSVCGSLASLDGACKSSEFIDGHSQADSEMFCRLSVEPRLALYF